MSDKRYEYRAMWKYKTRGGTYQKNFVAPSVTALLRTLEKSEGVTTTTVECLYIHDVTDGKPFECLTFEEAAGDGTFTYSERNSDGTPSNVVPIRTALTKKERKKLRIRLKNPPTPKFSRVALGLYTVMEMEDD